MDTSTTGSQLIQRILAEHTRIPIANGNIRIEPIFDLENDRYVLMLVGRDGKRRVHGTLVHVDIIGGKFHIQRDGTEYGIARELLEAGIPRDQIVMAFRPSDMQMLEAMVIA